MRTSILVPALLILSLQAAAAAHAAEFTKREGSFGKGDGALLTKDELRACLSQPARLAQQREALLKEQTSLAATKDEIGRSGEALKAKLDTLDRTKPEAVAAFNEEALARDKAINGYEVRVAAPPSNWAASLARRQCHPGWPWGWAPSWTRAGSRRGSC